MEVPLAKRELPKEFHPFKMELPKEFHPFNMEIPKEFLDISVEVPKGLPFVTLGSFHLYEGSSYAE
jgi:hypothetical protein